MEIRKFENTMGQLLNLRYACNLQKVRMYDLKISLIYYLNRTIFLLESILRICMII